MFSLAVLLSLAISALAYQVTSPNNVTGWLSNGDNTVSWNRVDTDPTSFAIFLVNQDRSVLPQNNQLLAQNVDGTKGSVVLSPPAGGLPAGAAFQVNFCSDVNNPQTILAQSNQFAITSGGSASAASSGTTATGTTTTGATVAASSPSGLSTIIVPPPASASAALNPSQSGSSNSSSHVSGALGLHSFEPKFLGAVVFIGALLL